MKITNVHKGKAYQLAPDTKLQVERPNLFFNEYGEQTNPVSLPDTDLNRDLLGYPDLISNRKKPSASIDATIEDDGYFIQCRQAVLSAQRKEAVSTSFYMNEGSFLSKISDTPLSDIFGDEKIPGPGTVDECIEFCRSLIPGTNPHYAIFPVLIDSEESFEDGTTKYRCINRYGFVDEKGKFCDYNSSAPYTTPDFYNAVSRTEISEGETVSLSPGYYLSPFIRGNYLLKRIFAYFGYSLKDNFFTRTKPFPDMVFVNNCADAIVKGTIRVTDLLPVCMCSTILNVYRKKFCCEFISDEVAHTVDIVLFSDVVKAGSQENLSPYLISQPKIDYPESYQQLIISSEEQVSGSGSVETFDSIADLLSKYKSAELNGCDGAFYRDGYQFMVLLNSIGVIPVSDKIAESSMRYYAGGNLKTKEISVPDCQPVFYPFYTEYIPGSTGSYSGLFFDEKFLYIGSPNFLNSKLVSNKSADTESSATKETSTSDASLKPILSFAYTLNAFPRGTISNYGVQFSSYHFSTAVRLFDYTLCYNGSDGIFERFYRPMDDIYRNSLHKVTAKFLLPTAVKQELSAHLPVNIQGENLLIDVLKYTLGGKSEPVETNLYTYRLYEPVDSARHFKEYASDPNYEWRFNNTKTELTESQYNNSPYKDRELVTVFPPPPCKELAVSGERFNVQRTALHSMFGYTHFYTLFEVWFTCVKRTTV